MVIVAPKTKAVCGIIIIKKESEASHNEKSINVQENIDDFTSSCSPFCRFSLRIRLLEISYKITDKAYICIKLRQL